MSSGTSTLLITRGRMKSNLCVTDINCQFAERCMQATHAAISAFPPVRTLLPDAPATRLSLSVCWATEPPYEPTSPGAPPRGDPCSPSHVHRMRIPGCAITAVMAFTSRGENRYSVFIAPGMHRCLLLVVELSAKITRSVYAQTTTIHRHMHKP